jgi:hypothetical protein
MGDIGKGNQVTSYPGALDTATPLGDCSGLPCSGGDTLVAGHVNNPVGAIVAIQHALGITPEGTAADLTARLSILLAGDGGLPRGTAFPIAPTPVPQFFYRTDLDTVYSYNVGTGSWVAFLTSATLGAYVPIASNVIITAQHTFNPPIDEAPFLLGAHATGQLVVGLRADTAAQDPASATAAAVANAIVKRDANKDIIDRNSNVLFGLASEASAKVTTAVDATLNLGTVTAGDRIFVTGLVIDSTSVSPSSAEIAILKSAGTATAVFAVDRSSLTAPAIVGSSTVFGTVSGLLQVTGSGTLTIATVVLEVGGTVTIWNRQIYAVFFKKQ